MRTGLRTLAVAAVAICLAVPALGVSVEKERELGRNFALAARSHLPLLNDPAVLGYVNRIGQRIASSLDDSFFDYHFSVVRDGSVNAFAVPGGYVYVNSGLLTRLSSDDELAAVLGHEIAHVHAHHLSRQQEATQLLNYATLLGALLSIVQPAIGAVATATNAAVQLRYSRDFEQEADYMGTRYARTAGYDPRAMLDFLQKLRDEQRLSPTSAPPYLLSHPLTDDRLNHLDAVLRNQGRKARPQSDKSFALEYVQVRTRALTEPAADVVAAYRAAVDSRPRDPEARFLFGVACLETGQYDAAEKALEEARAAGVPAAGAALGTLALRARQPERARMLLTQAVELDPLDAAAHADLAKTFEVLNDSESAMREYQRAIDLAPDLDSAHYALAMLAGRGGRSADGFYHLATAMRLRGEYAEALKQYERAEPLLPAVDPHGEEVRLEIKELSEFLHVPQRRPTETPEGSGH
jgi:beta-barrel assembly-enhancing protease